MKSNVILKLAQKSKSYIKIILVAGFISIQLLAGCKNSTKEQGEEQKLLAQTKTLTDKEILNIAKKRYGESIVNILSGKFMPDDSLNYKVLCQEVEEDTIWAIKFIFIKAERDSIREVWKTQNLEGSFNEAEVKIIRYDDLNYDLVFYDSKNYYAGNDLGEVFLYSVDLFAKKTNSAHAFYDQSSPPSVYFSPEISSEYIKKYYLDILRKRFGGIKISAKDYKFEGFF